MSSNIFKISISYHLFAERRRSSRLIESPWIYNWPKKAPVYNNLDVEGGNSSEGQLKRLIKLVQAQGNAMHEHTGTMGDLNKARNSGKLDLRSEQG